MNEYRVARFFMAHVVFIRLSEERLDRSSNYIPTNWAV